MPIPIPSRAVLLGLLAIVPTALSGAELAEAQRTRITDQARAFWSAFCREDLQALGKVADEVVKRDMEKALWIRDRLDRAQGKPVTATAAPETKGEVKIPEIAFGEIAETEVMSIAGLIESIPAYRVKFTSPAFNGTICVTRDADARVISFND